MMASKDLSGVWRGEGRNEFVGNCGTNKRVGELVKFDIRKGLISCLALYIRRKLYFIKHHVSEGDITLIRGEKHTFENQNGSFWI